MCPVTKEQSSVDFSQTSPYDAITTLVVIVADLLSVNASLERRIHQLEHG